jgi:DNA repair exonuclease SbcCD ATPase subunit
MRSTFKILFYLNTSKRKKSGTCPVMGRITIDGKIAQFSLKEDIHPDYWDLKKERATGKTREQIALNRKIDKTEQSIRDIYTKMVDNVGYVTAEQIKNELTGAVSKTEYLLELFTEHNQKYKKRIGIDRKDGTYSNSQFGNQYRLWYFCRLSQFDFRNYSKIGNPYR